jgi:hypothetical protein
MVYLKLDRSIMKSVMEHCVDVAVKGSPFFLLIASTACRGIFVIVMAHYLCGDKET